MDVLEIKINLDVQSNVVDHKAYPNNIIKCIQMHNCYIHHLSFCVLQQGTVSLWLLFKSTAVKMKYNYTYSGCVTFSHGINLCHNYFRPTSQGKLFSLYKDKAKSPVNVKSQDHKIDKINRN